MNIVQTAIPNDIDENLITTKESPIPTKLIYKVVKVISSLCDNILDT